MRNQSILRTFTDSQQAKISDFLEKESKKEIDEHVLDDTVSEMSEVYNIKCDGMSRRERRAYKRMLAKMKRK